MAVRKARLDCVMADLGERGDRDFALAGLQHFLARAMAHDFGRRAVDAHQLERDLIARAIGEGHFKHPRLLVHGDFGGGG